MAQFVQGGSLQENPENVDRARNQQLLQQSLQFAGQMAGQVNQQGIDRKNADTMKFTADTARNQADLQDRMTKFSVQTNIVKDHYGGNLSKYLQDPERAMSYANAYDGLMGFRNPNYKGSVDMLKSVRDDPAIGEKMAQMYESRLMDDTTMVKQQAASLGVDPKATAAAADTAAQEIVKTMKPAEPFNPAQNDPDERREGQAWTRDQTPNRYQNDGLQIPAEPVGSSFENATSNFSPAPSQPAPGPSAIDIRRQEIVNRINELNTAQAGARKVVGSLYSNIPYQDERNKLIAEYNKLPPQTGPQEWVDPTMGPPPNPAAPPATQDPMNRMPPPSKAPPATQDPMNRAPLSQAPSPFQIGREMDGMVPADETQGQSNLEKVAANQPRRGGIGSQLPPQALPPGSPALSQISSFNDPSSLAQPSPPSFSPALSAPSGDTARPFGNAPTAQEKAAEKELGAKNWKAVGSKMKEGGKVVSEFTKNVIGKAKEAMAVREATPPGEEPDLTREQVRAEQFYDKGVRKEADTRWRDDPEFRDRVIERYKELDEVALTTMGMDGASKSLSAKRQADNVQTEIALRAHLAELASKGAEDEAKLAEATLKRQDEAWQKLNDQTNAIMKDYTDKTTLTQEEANTLAARLEPLRISAEAMGLKGFVTPQLAAKNPAGWSAWWDKVGNTVFGWKLDSPQYTVTPGSSRATTQTTQGAADDRATQFYNANK